MQFEYLHHKGYKRICNRSFLTDQPDFESFYGSKVFAFESVKSKLFDKYFISKKLDDIIINCKYGAQKCDLNKDFEAYYDINYGVCFRFNSGKSMNNTHVNQNYAYISGIENGLDLELYIGSAIQNDNLYSIDNGFIIFITSESIDSNYVNDAISIPTGYSIKIPIEQYSINKMPKPYSNCLTNLNSIDSYDSECFRKTINANNNASTYHYKQCSSLCLQKYLGIVCKCQTAFALTKYFD